MNNCAITKLRVPANLLTPIDLPNMGQVLVLSEIAKHYATCSFCRKSFLIKNLNVVLKGPIQNGYLCNDCYSTKAFCRDCQCCYGFDKFDAGTCIACNNRKVIKPYNSRVTRYLNFLSKDRNGMWGINFDPKALYYGIELELELCHSDYEYDPQSDYAQKYKKEMALKCLKKIGTTFVIAKNDGSLNYGFEIVTTPATFDIQIEQWNKFFDWVEVDDNSSYFKQKENCGLHIHASKNYLSPLQIGKLIGFLYEPNNYEFISKIAQRGSNRYAQWDLKKKVSDVLNPTGVKYEALNLNNAKTIELRIFKSDLVREKFIKNLEFFDALIVFIQGATINESKDLKCFLKVCAKNAKKYPNLIKYIDKLGMEYK